LQDPANVNHCVETFFHIGERGDRSVRARTLLIDQMLHEPAFDQLRTKEQLGYVVFTGMRSLFTTCGIRFLIQSERTPQYLDTRIEAFLTRYADTLAEMSETEFEGHKRSVIVKRLEKLKNLNQESSRHWQQISNEFYDFEQGMLLLIPESEAQANMIMTAQIDAANVKKITKDEIVAFYKQYLDPASSERARLSVHLHAQGASELDKKMIALLEGLELNDIPQEKRQSVDLLESYLKAEKKMPEAEVSKVMEQAKDAGLKRALQESEGADATLLIADAVQSAIEIKDANEFKAGLTPVSGGRPLNPLSDFEDSETKL
jgi:insulysin